MSTSSISALQPAKPWRPRAQLRQTRFSEIQSSRASRSKVISKTQLFLHTQGKSAILHHLTQITTSVYSTTERRVSNTLPQSTTPTWKSYTQLSKISKLSTWSRTLLSRLTSSTPWIKMSASKLPTNERYPLVNPSRVNNQRSKTPKRSIVNSVSTQTRKQLLRLAPGPSNLKEIRVL